MLLAAKVDHGQVPGTVGAAWRSSTRASAPSKPPAKMAASSRHSSLGTSRTSRQWPVVQEPSAVVGGCGEPHRHQRKRWHGEDSAPQGDLAPRQWRRPGAAVGQPGSRRAAGTGPPRRSPPAPSLNWELTATGAIPQLGANRHRRMTRRIASSQVSSSRSGMRCPPLQLSRWADWIPVRSEDE
jgi:hypothetical protein